MNRYRIGIDAGGTYTRLRIVDAENGIRAEHTAPYTCKYFIAGKGKAAELITGIIVAVATEHGIALPDIEGICLGMAGGGNERDRRGFIDTLRDTWKGLLNPAKLILVTDAEIALEGALGGGTGAVLICGTGAIAAGKTNNGRCIFSGGWGRIIGDEGSGYWLGVQALNAIARELDGRGEKTMLMDEVSMDFPTINFHDTRDLRSAIYTGMLSIERIAPVVSRCAERGDAIAKDLVTRAAEELYALLAAFQKMHFSEGSNIPLCLHGGVVEHSPVGGELKVLLSKRLRGIYSCIEPLGSPLDGALQLLQKEYLSD